MGKRGLKNMTLVVSLAAIGAMSSGCQPQKVPLPAGTLTRAQAAASKAEAAAGRAESSAQQAANAAERAQRLADKAAHEAMGHYRK